MTEALPALILAAAIVDRQPQLLTSLWPDSLRDWLFVFITGGGVTAFWRISKVWHSINADIGTVSVRLSAHTSKVDVKMGKLETRIEAIDRDRELMQLNYTNLRESVSRMSVQVQTMAETFQGNAVERARQFGEIGARLERIETKVDERAARQRGRSSK